MADLGGGFIRIETYSREVAKSAKGKKTTSGAVIAEATRQEGFISHIEGGVAEPTLIYGVAPDEAYKEALTRLESERNDKGAKYRKDATVLLGGVASYPKPRVAINDEDKELIEEWKRRTIDFLKLEFGDNLRSVVEHHDEGYPHIHFYVIGDKVGETRKLHPGAKGEVGIADKGERLAAYGKALRTFQDNYYDNVSVYVGMTRTGPYGFGNNKNRKRGEWKKDKEIAEKLATRLKETDWNWEASVKRMAEAEKKFDDIFEQQENLENERKSYRKALKKQFEEMKLALYKEYEEMMGKVLDIKDTLTTAIDKARSVKGGAEVVKEIEADSGYITAEAIVSNYKKTKGLK